MLYYVIIFFFIIIRVIKAIVVPISYDEVVSLINYSRKSLSFIFSDYTYPNNHIFHSLLVKLSTVFFGSSEFFVRLPSVIGGILFCIFIYKIADIYIRNNYSKLFYLLLVLSNPYLIDINSMARGYGIGMALGFIAIFFFYQFFYNNTNSSKIRKISIPLLIIICSTLSIGTVPTFVNLFISTCAGFFLVFLFEHLDLKFKIKKLIEVFFIVIIPTFILTKLFYINIHVDVSKIPYGTDVKDFANCSISEFFLGAYLTDAPYNPDIKLCNCIKYTLLTLFFIGIICNISTRQKKKLTLYIIPAMAISLTYLECFMFKMRSPFPRNMVYLIPFFYLLIVDFMEIIIYVFQKYKKAAFTLSLLPFISLLVVNLANVNFTCFQIYKYHSVVRDMMLFFKGNKLNNIKLSCPFYLDPSIEYYNERFALSISKSDENSCDYALTEPGKESPQNFDVSKICYKKLGFKLLKK